MLKSLKSEQAMVKYMKFWVYQKYKKGQHYN